MQRDADEVMLAQEQGVRMRKSGEREALEGGLGGELEGTLVLTSRRIIFVCTSEKEDDLKAAPSLVMRLVYSDVEDLISIPKSGENLFIPLSTVTGVKGHTGRLGRPSLEVTWQEGKEKRGRVFIERLTGRSRRRNLNDWATVIERLRAGDQRLVQLPRAPPLDTIDGKIVRVLADMQRKGAFEIKEEVEAQFKVKLDSEDVETVLEGLVNSGILGKFPDPSGDVYYQKRSPLGDDAL